MFGRIPYGIMILHFSLMCGAEIKFCKFFFGSANLEGEIRARALSKN